jgi:hypothetical protein
MPRSCGFFSADRQRLPGWEETETVLGEAPVEAEGFPQAESLHHGERDAMENRTGGQHETGLRIVRLHAGEYAVMIGGRKVAASKGGSPQEIRLMIPVRASPTQQVIIEIAKL